MDRREKVVFWCTVMIAGILIVSIVKVFAQTQTEKGTRTEITQTVDQLTNTTSSPDLEKRGRLRGTTNADRIAAAKRAADARAEAAKAPETAGADMTNTTTTATTPVACGGAK